MSVWGRRGTYGATAFVVTFFVALSTVAYLAEPFVDREENTVLRDSDSDFMRMARFQSVRWREWGPDALAEAKRRDKPIMVFSGMPWSSLRERFDGLFSISEVSEYLNQDYVCIRVDALADPSWRSTPLAISRTLRGDPVDFFLGVFSADGEVLDIPSAGELDRMSDVVFLAYMSNLKSKYAFRNRPELHDVALAEVADLRGGTASAGTDALEYIDAEEKRLFLESRLLPYELELLLDEGRVETVSRVVDRLLVSNRTDVLWGGFFENWDPLTGTVFFSKSAFTNAGMLRVLTRLAVSTGEERYIAASRWQFDYILGRFALDTSSASDYAKPGDASRSGYFSFPRTRLDKILSADENRIAIQDLGLVSGKNVQATPYYTQLEFWSRPHDLLISVLKKLRDDVEKPDRIQGQMVSYEAQGECIRSLLFAARLLEDSDRLGLALSQFDSLRRLMRIGVDDVEAGPGLQPSNKVGLGTYLSYSAAAWEVVLSGGNVEIGLDGARVLKRAQFLYRDANDSFWSGSMSDFDSTWQKIIPSPVFDGSIRSPIGEFIRLTNLYGNWRVSGQMRGSFISARDRTLSQSSWVLSESANNLGTLARAVRQASRGVAIGFEGPVDWKTCELEFPGVPLIPISENGPAGFRVLRGGRWTGPHKISDLSKLIK